jgi:hypothetical protein
MFGCLRRLGCLFVLAVIVLAYFTRAYWYEPVRGMVARGGDRGADVGAGVTRWEPITTSAATQGEKQVRSLAAPRGPVYVSLRPGELASYAFLSLSNALPPSAEGAEASVQGERVYVRSVVALRDFAGALGSMGGFLADRDTLRLGGTFEVLAPGRAQFRVQDVQLGSFPLPKKTIPALLKRVRRGTPGADVAPDAIELPIPDYIGDVRIARGRITLYKRQ